MHFRILKMIATGCFLAALECTKNAFSAEALPRTPLGDLTELIQSPVVGLRGLLLSGGEGREGKQKHPSIIVPEVMCTWPTRLNVALTLAPQAPQLEFRVTSVGCMSDVQQDCSGG